MPVVILTGSTSFSSAEWMAFSLQRLGRATVIGEQTAGGAHPVTRVPIDDRLMLQVPFGQIRDPIKGQDFEGVGVTPDLIVPAHFEVESAEASVDAMIRRGLDFDGIVAASDLIALGAVRALLHAGISVPGQVSVIGFDNVPFSRYSRPALSTIAQDTMKAGRLMVSKLLDSSGDRAARSERVPTDLIVRETCGG